VQIRTFKLTAAKQWKLTNLNISFNYCDFAKGIDNPLLTVIAPGVRDKLASVLHQCPYKGHIVVQNYSFNMAKMMVRLPKGTKTKLEVNFLSNRRVPVFGIYSLSNVVDAE
jgi:Protein of unknown function (DUF1091)